MHGQTTAMFEGSELRLAIFAEGIDHESRQVYSWVVRDLKTEELLLEGDKTLRSAVGDSVDAREMIGVLANFLQPGHGEYASAKEKEVAEQYGETLSREIDNYYTGYFSGTHIFFSDGEDGHKLGWYWRSCFSGCLPEGGSFGPFDTAFIAYTDAKNEGE